MKFEVDKRFTAPLRVPFQEFRGPLKEEILLIIRHKRGS